MIWTKAWSRDYSYIYCDNCIKCFYLVGKDTGCYNHEDYFMLYEKGIVTTYIKDDKKNKFWKFLHLKYANNLKNLNQFINCFLKAGKEYYGFSIKIKSIEKLSNDEIVELLKEYEVLVINYTKIIWVIWNLQESFSEKCCNYFIKKSKSLGISNMEGYLDYISSPIKKASILKLNEHIEMLKKENKKIDYEKLFKKYQWLPLGDLHSKPWTLDVFRKYIDDYKLNEKKSYSLPKVAEDLKLNKEEIEMIKINKTLAYLRDYRDEIRRKTIYKVIPLFKEISKRLNIDYDNLMLLTIDEIIGEFSKKTKIVVDERRKKAVFYIENGKSRIVLGSDVDVFLKKNGFDLLQEKDVKEIRGLIASKGYAKGIAKIIVQDRDIQKIEKGDILVALTTHPEYVTKMQAAKAIVTDEGGLSCHAAIVARELGIPCIVGTKIATKVLKDNDLVEVDADNGVVKVVKR